MMICFALVSLTTLCSASWFIVHQHASDNSGTHSAPDTCDCHFTTEATYNGTAQFPTLTDAGVDIYGTDAFSFENVNLKFAKTDGITISGNKTITVATGNFDSATGVTVNFTRDVVWNWAGEYTCKIVDSQTGQTICSNHTYTIKQAKMTPVSLTLPTTPLFEDTSVSYTALWRGFQNGVDNNSNPTYDEGIISGTTSVVGFTDSGTLYKNQSLTISASNIAYENDNQTYADKFYNNYDLSNTPSQTGTYTVLAKAYSYDSSNGAKFHSTLNRALEATKEASTATTVVAMQSFTYNSTNYTAKVNGEGDYSHTISGARTVGANVTLVLPFRASSDFDTAAEIIQDGSGNYGNDRFAVDTNDDLVVDDVGDADGKLDAMDNNFVATPVCVNEVVLTGQLTVNGHVQICGITGVPYPSSSQSRGILQAVTSGKHATLTMKGDSASSPATLTLTTATTTLKVHGYIAQGNEYTKVIAQKGTISMPFVVYDYGGGGSTIALFKGSGEISYTDALKLVGGGTCDYLEQASNICPFSAFDMPNIQVMLECYGGSSGATIEALCTLFTNSISFASIINLDAQFNPTTFNVFAPSNALIQMSSGTATFHYDAAGDYRYEYDGYIPARSTRTEITLSGTTTSGNVTLSLSIGGIIDSSVTFADIKFPISDKLKLTLTNDYTYTFTTAFKFLPGSELYITNGAKVNVGSSSNTTAGLLFYNKLEGASICYNFYTPSKRTTPAVCNIANGSLVVYGSIGGTITASSQNGIVNLNNASALSMNEVEGIGDNSGLTFTFTQKQNINLNVSGYTATNDSYKLSDPMAKTQYSGSSRAVTATSYAWKTNTITATLDANGGSVSNTTPSLTVPAAGYTTANLDSTYVPTRTYYTFQHWCTSQNCTNGESCSARPSSLYQNTTLYAIWTPNTYDITFDAHGGVFSDNSTSQIIQITYGSKYTLPSSNPTYTGYTFAGWESGGSAVTTDTTMMKGAHTVTAKWTGNSYTVTLDAAGGTFDGGAETTTTTVTFGSGYGNLTKPTRSGYILTGWKIGDVTVSVDSIATTTVNTASNHTLTAVWEELSSDAITITLSVYGTTSSVTQNIGTTLQTSHENTPDHYTLTGWSLTENGTPLGTDYKLTAEDNGKTFYALLTPNSYTVTYDPCEGSVSETTITVVYNNSVTLPTPTRTGYRFLGWYTAETGGTEVGDAGASYTPTANVTLYAQWIEQYTVTYNANGGTVDTANETVDAGGSVTLPTPTRTGYTFDGWYTSGGTEAGDADASYTPTGNVTLKAQWTVNSYTITVTTSNATVKVNGTTVNNNGTISIEYGTQVTVEVTYSKDRDQSTTIKGTDGTTYTSPFTMPAQDVTINATSSSSCLVEGTLITLADGTQKKIEDLTYSDQILAWNLFKGEYQVTSASYIVAHELQNYRIVNLLFSDGTVVRIAGDHGFFDADLNKFVFINESNVEGFIGHRFVQQNGDTYSTVALQSYTVTEEYVRVYSLASIACNNVIANGMFSLTPVQGIDSEHFFNFIAMGDDMRYDAELLQKDIETYGLFTYEDFADYMSQEEFAAFEASNGCYLKIAVAKGYITVEQIFAMLAPEDMLPRS